MAESIEGVEGLPEGQVVSAPTPVEGSCDAIFEKWGDALKNMNEVPVDEVALPEFDEQWKMDIQEIHLRGVEESSEFQIAHRKCRERQLLEALRKLSVMNQEARLLNEAHKHAEANFTEAMKQRNFLESSYEDADASRALAVAEGKITAENLKNAREKVQVLESSLMKEWSMNHSEHCTGDSDPCPGPKTGPFGCNHPVPEVMNGHTREELILILRK